MEREVDRDESVLAAVRTDLDKRATREREPAMYALALNAARRLDEVQSNRDVAQLQKELRDTLEQIRGLLPPVEEVADGVDDLERARAARRASQAS